MNHVITLFSAIGLIIAQQAMAGSQTPAMDDYYASHPIAWYNQVSELEYFDTQLTTPWVTNPSCQSPADFTSATYNIFHNVGFVYDFGDEMEQSLGKVTACADVILIQEAWDYDDMYEDGPVDDFAARGFSVSYGGGDNYCNGSDIEGDCSGLMIFSQHGFIKELGYHKYQASSGIDSVKGKGVIGAIVEKDGRYVYVFNTHLVYGSAQHLGGNSSNDNARRGQMNEAISWIAARLEQHQQQYPAAAIVFGGDFNTDLQNTGAIADVTQNPLWNSLGLIRQQATEVRDGLRYTYWPKDDCCEDTGPNGLAEKDYAWFDYSLILNGPAGCAEQVITSAWAPQWLANDGQRYLAYYTHSDHYGSLTEMQWCQ
ncbi:endonuclease [Bacterioplanes sanyensis]|uniref:Endonuclease n=1 Tax=Bacterioplanes sanyensis TaxID=1249553 RepID=A0A222FNJ7_9GAMM|nr:hypothetical protein [Bacterioplanes sanyensis]ASP40094.1 endonuclease [Bacterioplanes sanyensis]